MHLNDMNDQGLDTRKWILVVKQRRIRANELLQISHLNFSNHRTICLSIKRGWCDCGNRLYSYIR